MTPDGLVTLATDIALVAFLAALALTAIRIVLGPTLADRVLGLDMLVAVAIGFIAAFAIATGQSAYLDIALALGLVGFLATIAFARFIYVTAGQEEGSQTRVREASGEGAGRTGKPDETGEAG